MSKSSRQLWFDRLLNGGTLKQILLLLAFTVCVFFVFSILFVMLWGPCIGHTADVGRDHHFWQLYYYFVDAGNQMSMGHETSSTGRVIALVMSTLGSIFLSGVLISTITNTIERRVEDCRNGEVYYSFSGHIVIIGSDKMVQSIVRRYAADSSVEHIVVLTSGDVERLRSTIEGALPDKAAREKVVVNYGTRDSSDFLTKINITAAREVFIVGDDSEFDHIENFHDSLNVECMRLIAALCKDAGRENALPCYVSFDSDTSYHIFQCADLPADITAHIDFHPFNFYEMWAQKVLIEGSDSGCDECVAYPTLDRGLITTADSTRYVHLVIVGFSEMGRALALQTAIFAHYPNYRRRKTRITVIDRYMRSQVDAFKQNCGELFSLSHSCFIDADEALRTGTVTVEESHIDRKRYGHLITDPSDPDFIDVEWTFIHGDDTNPVVRSILEGYAADSDAILTVAMCLNLSDACLRSAMYLPRYFYDKDIPVLVQQRMTDSMVNAINGSRLPDEARKKLQYKNLLPFGMIYDCFDPTRSEVLRRSMRINAVYSLYFGNKNTIPTSIPPSLPETEWKKLGTTKHWSNIYSAVSIPTKLRCAGLTVDAVISDKFPGFTDEQIALLSEMEHNRWNIEELLLGYRPVSADEDAEIDADPTKKGTFRKLFIHYDIRPYDGLKADSTGAIAAVYDEVIIRSIPLILRYHERI